MRFKIKSSAQAMIEYLIVACALFITTMYLMNELNFMKILKVRNETILERLQKPTP